MAGLDPPASDGPGRRRGARRAGEALAALASRLRGRHGCVGGGGGALVGGAPVGGAPGDGASSGAPGVADGSSGEAGVAGASPTPPSYARGRSYSGGGPAGSGFGGDEEHAAARSAARAAATAAT
ncbi:hypothetical protein SCE1572_22180 [Sorangium cellulosum So0157-2]|uniref:Uncharacterized protein n=1 Tax=Sorangium cellulosum So0157-2 TaxID=1254432 RepID=S4XYI8_SORCE|nr:hypothetical protein SCE1572_22180 [Sorangium cellulosum So0157-2]